MPDYVVKPGDTLWGIAKANGIRYWPNVYFARENNQFRADRSDPNRTWPGDHVFVPDLKSIAPMEREPVKVYKEIPLFTQSSETCWRVEGRGQPLTYDFSDYREGLSRPPRIEFAGALRHVMARSGKMAAGIGWGRIFAQTERSLEPKS